MLFEDQAAYLQQLKTEAGLDLDNPRQRLLSELTDTGGSSDAFVL